MGVVEAWFVVCGSWFVVVEEEDEEEDERVGFKKRSWKQINEGLAQLCEVESKKQSDNFPSFS